MYTVLSPTPFDAVLYLVNAIFLQRGFLTGVLEVQDPTRLVLESVDAVVARTVLPLLLLFVSFSSQHLNSKAWRFYQDPLSLY